MPNVKDNPVSREYRAVIHGFLPDHAKQFISTRARVEKTNV
jgi:hypothetical protein